MTDINDADDLKQEVANAVIASDEIDNENVVVGEPMAPSDAMQMIRGIALGRDIQKGVQNAAALRGEIEL